MTCSVEWVQPNSAGSNENTLWYLAMSWQAASANSRVQDPDHLSLIHQTTFHAFASTVSLGVWKSVDLPIPSCNPLDLGGPGTGDAAAALAKGLFLEGLWVCSVVPYHYNCLFTALSQLSLCVLYSQAQRQSALPVFIGPVPITLIHSSKINPSLSLLVLYVKRRALKFLLSGYTSMDHCHLSQTFLLGHHPLPHWHHYVHC